MQCLHMLNALLPVCLGCCGLAVMAAYCLLRAGWVMPSRGYSRAVLPAGCFPAAAPATAAAVACLAQQEAICGSPAASPRRRGLALM